MMLYLQSYPAAVLNETVTFGGTKTYSYPSNIFSGESGPQRHDLSLLITRLTDYIALGIVI